MKNKIIEKTLAIAEYEFQNGGGGEIWGWNDGPQVRKYLRAVGITTPSAWCMAFVWWCINKACLAYKQTMPIPKTGYCPYMYDFGKKNNIIVNDPKPGDIVIFDDGRTDVPPYYHVALTKNWDLGDIVTTIEGNTNGAGSAEGDGIYYKNRYFSSKYYRMHFLRWINLLELPGDTTITIEEETVPVLLKGKDYQTLFNGLRIEGEIYVPVRKFAETLGKKVSYYGGEVIVSGE